MTIFLTGKQRSGSGLVRPAVAALACGRGEGEKRGEKKEGGGGGSTPLLTSGAAGVGRRHLSGDNELQLRYWWWHNGVRERDGATGYDVAANGGLGCFTSAGGT
jgi:hypothetical protein